MTPPVGRPQLSPDKKRSNILRIRLTDGERKLVDSVSVTSTDSNLNTSKWARKAILDYAKKTMRATHNKQEREKQTESMVESSPIKGFSRPT